MATHNGYTNYETWTIMNAIGNTSSLYNFFENLVKECREKTSSPENCKAQVMHITKNVLDSMKPNTNNPYWEPLINGLQEDHINFSEIADHLMEDFT